MLNRLFAFIILIFLSPIFLLVSLAILIEDGFPIFFTQKRVGINYSFFNIPFVDGKSELTEEALNFTARELEVFLIQ